MLNIISSSDYNFSIRINALLSAKNPLGGDEGQFISVDLDFGDSKPCSQCRIPVQDLSKFNWEDIDLRCQYNSKYSPTRIKRAIANKIRFAICNDHIRSITSVVFDKTGIYKIADKPVFCVGKEVICSPLLDKSSLEFNTDKVLERMDIDTNLNEKDSIEQMLALVGLCHEPGMVILSQVAVYLMRRIYADIGIKPCVCVFLYGETGKKKTTYSSFLTQIYNRASGIKNPVRLNASIPAAVSLLAEARDCVTIFDDLFPADSKNIRNKQEETLGEIIRFIGDGTVPAKVRGKNVKTFEPECGVLFTGEYIVGTGSDAARIFPVEMQNVDGELLSYFQENPLIVSTFYYYFMIWIIEKYDDITEFLKAKDDEYHKSNFEMHGRLKRTLYFLDSSFACIMCFCTEKGYLSVEEAEEIQQSFQDIIIDIALKQQHMVDEKIPEATVSDDYLSYIAKCYNDGTIFYANNYNEYTEGLHDGVIHNGCLCLRGEWLSKVFPNIPLNKIADSLTVQRALVRGKQASKQISNLKGKRFYFILLTALCNQTENN